jgi:hypothetical protein
MMQIRLLAMLDFKAQPTLRAASRKVEGQNAITGLSWMENLSGVRRKIETRTIEFIGLSWTPH